MIKDKDLQITLYLWDFFGSICKIEHGDSENVHFIVLYPTLFEDKVFEICNWINSNPHPFKFKNNV